MVFLKQSGWNKTISGLIRAIKKLRDRLAVDPGVRFG
jgi:hypothetical protein